MHSEPDIIDPCDHAPLDWTCKGIPQDWLGKSRQEIAALRLPFFDSGILFPMAVLREEILRSNSAWMMRFLARFDAQLAPHGKTTMSPDLLKLQMRSGAWGVTAATAHHVRAYRRWGARRILMANPLVGDSEIRWIAAELARDPDFEFYCLVDSIERTHHLAEHLAVDSPGRAVNVLLEVGTPGGRAGVRTLEHGLEVAAAVSGQAQLRLCGVETFEGLFLTEPDGEERARQMLERVVELTRSCDERGYFANDTILLSGGGSGLFDLAAAILCTGGFSRSSRVIVRSGCYIAHDDGMYRMLFERLKKRLQEHAGAAAGLEGGLEPALQVWARVQSRPEPGRAICGLGKRDIGSDSGPPVAVAWVRQGTSNILPVQAHCEVTGLNDQHAYLEGDALPFRVGDLVGFGISHPCTTFDKWRALLTVNDRFEITGLVRTYF